MLLALAKAHAGESYAIIDATLVIVVAIGKTGVKIASLTLMPTGYL